MNRKTNNDEQEYEPLPSTFFPDDTHLPPRKMKEYGYRLAKGMPYRLYSVTEFKEMIKDGRALPIKNKAPAKKYVWQVGDEIPAQLTIIGTARRCRYLREMLKRYTITLSWEEKMNRPKIEYSRKAPTDKTNHP